MGSPAKVLGGWTLAIVSEGYTQDQLEAGFFEIDVGTFLLEFLNTTPFNDPALRRLMNVAEVRRASVESGQKIRLLTPAPENSPFRTSFGAMFGRDTFKGQQIERLLYGDSLAVKNFVTSQPTLKWVSAYLVIVNNTALDGGAMHGGVAWVSKARSSWPAVAVHELGHQAFDLADEYSYRNHPDESVRTYSDAEPSDPNVTTDTNVATMKWGGLVNVPQSWVPTTKRETPCVSEHPVLDTHPPIPNDAVGAFEGANYFSCGIFRPSKKCKMLKAEDPFCQVCERKARERIGHYMVSLHMSFNNNFGGWTHVQPFTPGQRTRVLAYDAADGRYTIVSPMFPNPPATASIDPDWTWIVPFTLNGRLHCVAHRFGSGRQGMFETDAAGNTLSPTWSSGPGIAWTHGVGLTLEGAPHFISYNAFTGDASLFRVESSGSEPIQVTPLQLGAGHTAVVSVTVEGRPSLLTYRMTTGEVILRQITTSGFVTTFASASRFWRTNITHVAPLELSGNAFIVRYSAIDGTAVIHHIRAGGSNIDRVCDLLPTPGFGGLSILGVGAPAIGWFSGTVAGTQMEGVFFYNALFQSLRVWTLVPS
jgi:hypothetical protein